MATGDGTIGNTAEMGLVDVNSDFSGESKGSLTGTFFFTGADIENIAYSTVAHDINRQVEEANYPLGKPVTGNEIVAAELTFNGQPITDPNGVLKDFGSFETAAVSAIEIDHSGLGTYPGISTPEIGEQSTNAEYTLQV